MVMGSNRLIIDHLRQELDHLRDSILNPGWNSKIRGFSIIKDRDKPIKLITFLHVSISSKRTELQKLPEYGKLIFDIFIKRFSSISPKYVDMTLIDDEWKILIAGNTSKSDSVTIQYESIKITVECNECLYSTCYGSIEHITRFERADVIDMDPSLSESRKEEIKKLLEYPNLNQVVVHRGTKDGW